MAVHAPIMGAPSGASEINRRGILGFAAGAGAIALASPIAAMPSRADRWSALRLRYEQAAHVADDYWRRAYEPGMARLNVIDEEQPPLWFEHRATNGQVGRFRVDPKLTAPAFPSPLLNDLHAAAATTWNEWYKRRCHAELETEWSGIAQRMDQLWSVEDAARSALMKEPAPNAAALALKVKLALDNDELWVSDRKALVADLERLV